MATMTGRQRMLAALNNREPDCVPVAPDISIMVPTRLTGKPFWETNLNSNPPLWKAYIDAANYYDIDAWCIHGSLEFIRKHRLESESTLVKGPEEWRVRTVIKTPEGDLTTERLCSVGNPAVNVEKMIKSFKEDFKKLKYVFSDVTGYDDTLYQEQKRYLGERGIMAIFVDTPGIQIFGEYFNGNHEAAIFAMVDEPDLFEELVELTHRTNIQKTEIAIEAGVESIITGGSGSITLQSPDIWYRYSFPTLKEQAAMCRQSGVLCGVHSCGLERIMVEKCALESDLSYINPLEIPPHGDCDLAELKALYGDKIALMGNLHTTDVMLNGSPEAVELASLKAIRDAAEGGGFVLSTGDQCGRDTPDENLFAMVATARRFGTYPLHHGLIDERIAELEDRRHGNTS